MVKMIAERMGGTGKTSGMGRMRTQEAKTGMQKWGLT
jgi:hypothetical protein